MNKKRCFTVIEVLISSTILLMVITIGASLLFLMNTMLYDSQIESSNRIDLNDTVFYLTREIQSAEGIIFSNDGKEMKIKQRGSEDYSLIYTITENYPVDYLAFKGKRLIDIECAGSNFAIVGRGVTATMQIEKNSTQLNQIPQMIRFTIMPRSDSVILKVE